MLYLNCSMIPSVDLAHYGVSCAEDLVSGFVMTYPIKKISKLKNRT